MSRASISPIRRAVATGAAMTALAGVYGLVRGVVYGLGHGDGLVQALDNAWGAAVFAGVVGLYIAVLGPLPPPVARSDLPPTPPNPRAVQINDDLARLRAELEQVKVKKRVEDQRPPV